METQLPLDWGKEYPRKLKWLQDIWLFFFFVSATKCLHFNYVTKKGKHKKLAHWLSHCTFLTFWITSWAFMGSPGPPEIMSPSYSMLVKSWFHGTKCTSAPCWEKNKQWGEQRNKCLCLKAVFFSQGLSQDFSHSFTRRNSKTIFSYVQIISQAW